MHGISKSNQENEPWAILMYAKLVTHNKGEKGYNECKVLRACLEPALMRGWLKLTPN